MKGQMDYQGFIARKSQNADQFGFEPIEMPSFLFDFQAYMVEWALRKGRCALFEDCGLGKTPQLLVWADNVVKHTGKPVLIVTPLAVSYQTCGEGEKFGIAAARSVDGSIPHDITVTNYERLHLFDPDKFGGVVCDESSAIKAFDGKRRKQVTRFLSKMPYRLLCTATAAPNDYVELGTSSEALGYMGQIEMLGAFFKNDDKTVHVHRKDGDFWNRHKWVFKAHSEDPFWRWVCSWARAIRTPADVGFDPSRFMLPALNIQQHVVRTEMTFGGELFARIAATLAEQREERKATIKERVAKVAELVDHDQPAVVWCQYNDEGDMLERAIEGSVQVSGADSDDAKEEKLMAFTRGEVRVIVTKPKIGAWGLNWQHCGHHTFFPSHSFEQYYQAIRRSLRFGRVGEVKVDIVTTEGEAGVTANLKRKQVQADRMFERLVEHMNNAMSIERKDTHTKPVELPTWIAA